MEKQVTELDIFCFSHIYRVVLIVRKIRPGIRILIWDDILRNEHSITNQNSVRIFHSSMKFFDDNSLA
jgi:hypothetical protein